MRGRQAFDEVMIINPVGTDPDAIEGVNLMRFHYAQSPEQYGYFAEAADPYGYYAQPPEYGYYGEAPEPYGYFAEVPETYGYYGEPPEYGTYGYGQFEPVGYYAEDLPFVGYGEEYPVGYYGEDPYAGYGEVPELAGYGEGPYMAEGMGYAECAGCNGCSLSGYVRDGEPLFNAGCPIATNVQGFGETAPFEGYVKPSTVNPEVTQYTPAPGVPGREPETFRPLW